MDIRKKLKCTHVKRNGEPCGHKWHTNLTDKMPDKCPKCGQWKVVEDKEAND